MLYIMKTLQPYFYNFYVGERKLTDSLRVDRASDVGHILSKSKKTYLWL